MVARFARWEALARTVVIDASDGAVDGAVGDPGLRAHRRYGGLGGRLVLVRPDGYVACSAPLSRPRLVERYLEMLTGDHPGRGPDRAGGVRRHPRLVA